jgi:hypothetical protein
MDKQLLSQKIVFLINTLNEIEVHKEQNLNYMLGCIQTLKSMLEEINQDDLDIDTSNKEENK